MDDLRERVAAVERALSDGAGDLTALAEGAATAERVAELEGAVESLDEEVDELAAATQALRGYVGHVRSVNESVEERAEAATAAVESIEARLDRLDAAKTPANPAAGDGDATPAGGTDGPEWSGAGQEERRCEACGRPRDAPPSRRSVGSDDEPEFGGEDRPRTGVTAESVGGFDPDETGERVRVRRDDGTDPPGTDLDRSGDDGDDHLFDRVRNLL